jgi:hypothetical protein
VAGWPDVRSAVTVGVAGLYAAVASLSRPLSGWAGMAVAVPVGIVLILAWPTPPPAPAAGPVRRTAAAWTVLLALAGTMELVAFVRQPAYNVASPDLPTLSVLLDPVTGAGPTRFLAWCGWLWVGWRLVRR